MLPLVELVRVVLYGSQSYTSARLGCSSLDASQAWVHPTALVLTVYGDTQRILGEAFGPHGTEVLPDDADNFAGVAELLCVADYLLAVTRVEDFDGRPVRRIVFDIPENTYGIANGWVSGLAQGMAGQVLLAAHLETGDGKYLRAARELRNLFFVPVTSAAFASRFHRSRSGTKSMRNRVLARPWSSTATCWRWTSCTGCRESMPMMKRPRFSIPAFARPSP